MKLTKKKAIELHQELWDWLYHHPSKRKEDWPRWENNGGNIPYIVCLCFLCAYRDNTPKEECCILDWNKEKCYNDGAYLWLWDEAEFPETRKKYAKLIRDLPKRK